MKYTYGKETRKAGKESIYEGMRAEDTTLETAVYLGRRKVAIVWKFANEHSSENYVVWLTSKYSPKPCKIYVASVAKPTDAGKVLDAYFSKIKKLAKELGKINERLKQG